jgi:medium-chain acyl-[acyl-carrier-protein] hydrolase
MIRPLTNPTDRWLPKTHSSSQKGLGLFCFPYAGGGASLFRDWVGALGGTVEVCPVQFPGREGRFQEPAFTRLVTLVDSLVDSLDPHLDRPFALFGHSLGALVAFEFARRLRVDGRPGPAHLFASGCRAPQVARAEPWVHTLPDTVFRDEMRRLGGTPPEILDDHELMDLLLPTLRADFALYETYVYADDRPLTCPFSVLGGRDDDMIRRSNLDAWRAQTTAPFRRHILPGSHFFLRSARPLLLAKIGRVLSNPTAYQQTGGHG